MLTNHGIVSGACRLILLTVMVAVAKSSTAQTTKLPEKPPSSHSGPIPENSDDLEVTRQQFFKLLRISPKLTMVLARDPTLLADEQYVSRNNPVLEQFLQTHPEIVRNPEFYLFAHLGGQSFSRELRMEEIVWPEVNQLHERRVFDAVQSLLAFLVFICVLLSLLWLIRILMENRRWTRIFNRQSAAQNTLLEKFASSEEMLNYMRSDSGKHFFEFTTTPATLGAVLQSGSPLARVLTPLQFGVVLTLVGIGFLILKSASVTNGQLWASETQGPLLVLGVVTSTLGVGLIVSAGVSWAFARHLGILPAQAERKGHSSADDSRKSQ